MSFAFFSQSNQTSLRRRSVISVSTFYTFLIAILQTHPAFCIPDVTEKSGPLGLLPPTPPNPLRHRSVDSTCAFVFQENDDRKYYDVTVALGHGWDGLCNDLLKEHIQTTCFRASMVADMERVRPSSANGVCTLEFPLTGMRDVSFVSGATDVTRNPSGNPVVDLGCVLRALECFPDASQPTGCVCFHLLEQSYLVAWIPTMTGRRCADTQQHDRKTQ